MFTGNHGLFLLLPLVFLFFGVLIFFLLKQRKNIQKENALMTPDQAWESLSKCQDLLTLKKSNMLFGIWQDATATKMSLLVKNSNNEIVGEVLTQTGSRLKEIRIGDNIFLIENLLTWKHTAVLRSAHNPDIIAKYTKTGWFVRHQYDIREYGLLKSKWVKFNLKSASTYYLDNKFIGIRQELSARQQKGRIAVLPSDLSLEVRLFILYM
jgi:hypothetical protein